MLTLCLAPCWLQPAEESVLTLPLPPQTGHQELNLVCGECRGEMNLDISLRSPGESCPHCAETARLLNSREAVQLLDPISQPADFRPASLTAEELAFLGLSAQPAANC